MSDTLTEPRTAPAIAHVLAFLSARADNAGARAWDTVVRDAAYAGARGTMRAWMEAHTGQDVRTLQANVHTSGDVYSVWTPGGRTVSAVRPGSVRLGESTRDYAGCRVLAATDATLIIATDRVNDAQQVAVYTVG
jgi:hypothetical protein